ncbi:MAG: glutamate racemase [Oscillospiraceae bacterium]|nr:glutamate racemase [Oscillospiraceae bacterium]
MKKIGVFDSGIGGLTVLHSLRRACPELDMVFLGDVARMPYGVQSRETVLGYSRDCAAFLRKQGVEAVIIACNTATAASLTELRQELDIPVYGVIEFAAEAAKRATRSGRIGVIATDGTVRSGSYTAALSGYTVLERPASPLVTMIESGIADSDERALAACRSVLADLPEQNIDTLILGCTHFPVYAAPLDSLLPGVTLIDTGAALAEALRTTLGGSGSGKTEYYTSLESEAFCAMVRRLDPAAGEIRVMSWN